MASRIAPLSASDNRLVRGIRRAGVSRANRTMLIFLAPFLLVGAGYLSTDSAQNPDSNLQFFGQNNDAGVILNAVAVPRYIPQNLPNYQETEVPAPDLTVAKANDTGGNATVGNPFNWTLTVANGGTSAGTFADTLTILQDTLPAGPAYGSPTAGNFADITNSEYISCSIVIEELTCIANGGDVTIIAGGSFTVTFSATPAAPGVLANTATVDPGDYIAESNEGNNTGSNTVTVTSPGPDLTITKANDTGGNATVDIPFTWTLTVANGGTSAGTFTDTLTILQDTLPAGPAYGSPTAGDFNLITNSGNISCSIDLDVLTCTAVGGEITIGAGGSFTISFSATPAAPGVLDNTATVDPDNSVAESNEGNNTGSDSVTVAPPAPDLTITKANDTGGNATVGILFSWTLTVANGGTGDGTFADGQTILQDPLPAGPAYSSPTAGNFNLITNSANISCSIDLDVLTCTAVGGEVTIGTGGSFTVSFPATPAAPGVLDNTATVDPNSSVAESNEGNNTGSDSVTVASAPEAPYNDNFSGAIAATPLSFTSIISTTGASTDGNDPEISCISGGPSQGSKSVWYSYPATKYEAITIDTTDSDYATVVAVWRGTWPDGLTEVACRDNAPVTVALIPGTTYYIEVVQSGGDTGGTLHFSVEAGILHGLRGDYFDNPNLSGTPVLTRVDPFIAFDWTILPPDPIVPNQDISVRWTGRILPQYSETYTFSIYSDDGVRLYVDDQLLIENWVSHELELNTATIALQAGTYYSIRLEYFQTSGSSVVELRWSSASLPDEIIPTGALDYLDVENSTVTGDGVQPLADGLETSAITVTLHDSQGRDVSGVPVYLKVSGSGNYVNGSAVAPGVWILIGYSNEFGVAIGTLASTSVGDKTVDAMAGGVRIGLPVMVTFVAGPVQRISVSHISGREGEEADSHSYFPSVSNDGSRVVFLSWATNLLPDDDSGNPNIFILNTETNLLSPAVFEGNGQPNDLISDPKISGNGQFVVFTSVASNLSTSCTDGGANDIFLYQIVEGGPGTFTCISVGPGGAEGNGSSVHPSISDDGRYIVFASTATNLVDGVTDGIRHIYLYDRNTATMSVVSRNSAEELANGPSDNPSISADGMSIAFESEATNLLGAGGDNNGYSDIFLRIRSGSENTIRLSVAILAEQEPNGASTLPSISSDGTRVAFLSNAGNLVSGAEGVKNVFVRNISGNSTVLVSVNLTGGGADGNSEFARISSDGLHVIFSSTASNLVTDENSGEQIYLRDFENQDTIKISKSADGAEGNNSSPKAGISGDGTTIVFESIATNLLGDGNDNNNASDIFLTEWVAPPAPPLNDTFAEAFSAADLPYSNSESTLLATRDIPNDPIISCGGSPSQHYNSVWYTIQPSVNTRLDLSTAGSDYDTVMAVWAGTPGSLTEVACNDDAGGVQSELDFLALAGTRYWIEVVQKGAPGGGSLVFSMNAVSAPPVYVYVVDTSGTPDAGLTVRAFVDDEDTGYSAVTNGNGEATFILPEAPSYRFQVIKNGKTYWSGNCAVPGCPDVGIVTIGPVKVTVKDTAGNPDVGLTVSVFTSSGYAGYSAITNDLGEVSFLLPEGNYHFRVMKNLTAFWSGPAVHCTVAVPGCTSAPITTNVPVTITVRNGAGQLEPNIWVHAFSDSGFTGLSFKTDANGQVRFTLNDGNYRFRADKLDRAFWSGTTYHCSVPASCSDFTFTIYNTVVVHVQDTTGAVQAGLTVHAFGDTSENFAITDSNGDARILVPNDEYRFRVIKDGTTFWSGPAGHCVVPDPCSGATLIISTSVTITVVNGAGLPEPNIWVHAFSESGYTNLSFKTDTYGRVRFTLNDGNYRFRADKLGRPFWSGTTYHCSVPASCSDFTFTISNTVVVHVQDTQGAAQAGLTVHAFGDTSENFAITDSNGDARLLVPNDEYRFRVIKDNATFWSGPAGHCVVPDPCSGATVTINAPLTITVVNGAGQPEPNIWVHAFQGSNFANLSFKTDTNGQVRFTLNDGQYRFRADKLGRAFWSGAGNDCNMPTSCANFTLTVYNTVLVHVKDFYGVAEPGLTVRAFGDTSENFAFTDSNGDARLLVPNDEYRFGVLKNNTTFWSGPAGHCVVPNPCTGSDIITNVPITVKIVDGSGNPAPDVWVHAFSTDFYTGLSYKTDVNGVVHFTLNDGNYRFRADKLGRAFWSSTTNTCRVPEECSFVQFSVGTTFVVHVHDTGGNPDVGVIVHAFGATSENYATTDSDGNATLQLPSGNYRFRALKNNATFWSGPAGHCVVPDPCSGATVITNAPVRVTVVDQSSQPQANVWVHTYSGSGFAGFSYKTDISGNAYFTLSDGAYRFRADTGNRGYWSSAGFDCLIPSSCPNMTISVYNSVVVHVQDTSGNPDVGVEVRAYGPTNQIFAYTDPTGNATLQLPFGDYRFRVKKGLSLFWSGAIADCTVPGCANDTIITNVSVTVTVLDHDGLPEAGLWVHAFLGTNYTGISFRTDSEGKAYFVLNDGGYRFRADKGNRGYWSGPTGHCVIPGCNAAGITTHGSGYAFAPGDWNAVFMGVADRRSFLI